MGTRGAIDRTLEAVGEGNRDTPVYLIPGFGILGRLAKFFLMRYIESVVIGISISVLMQVVCRSKIPKIGASASSIQVFRVK